MKVEALYSLESDKKQEENDLANSSMHKIAIDTKTASFLFHARAQIEY